MPSAISVLYEDDALMVFDKPSGVLVIPSPGQEKNTLSHLVNQLYASKDNTWKLHPCHRLDRDTSGCIIFAKGKHNQQLMMREFQKLDVQKKYIALIHGRLKKQRGEIRALIQDQEQKKFQSKSPPKLAITRYEVLQIRKKYSIVEVFPITGRTNQIRIQFSQIGCPLVGERKYAFARDYALKFRRTALHAESLRWNHPISHKPIEVTSPLPKDMEVFIARN